MFAEPQCCHFDCREGSRSDMDGAIARTEQSGDDSELADGLTRREHDILAFERQWWKYSGSKEDAIKELFSMSATRYYQVLNALVDRPEALAADPMLVKRLRRLRAGRPKARAARRLGFEVTGRPALPSSCLCRFCLCSGYSWLDERARTRLFGPSTTGHGDGAVVPGCHFPAARLAGPGFVGIRRRGVGSHHGVHRPGGGVGQHQAPGEPGRPGA